jgi:hypothetical protein
MVFAIQMEKEYWMGNDDVVSCFRSVGISISTIDLVKTADFTVTSAASLSISMTMNKVSLPLLILHQVMHLQVLFCCSGLISILAW